MNHDTFRNSKKYLFLNDIEKEDGYKHQLNKFHKFDDPQIVPENNKADIAFSTNKIL